MRRSLCLVGMVALLLCGCARKDIPHETDTAEAQPLPDQPAESNEPAPPAQSEHPVVAVAREFFHALAAGNYHRALALSVPGEFTEQGLAGIRAAFQLDQVTFTQAWLGAEQSAVITNFIPARHGTATAAWAINLVATEDGRWLVRLNDILPTQQYVEDYLAAFHEVAPNAASLEL